VPFPTLLQFSTEWGYTWYSVWKQHGSDCRAVAGMRFGVRNSYRSPRNTCLFRDYQDETLTLTRVWNGVGMSRSSMRSLAVTVRRLRIGWGRAGRLHPISCASRLSAGYSQA